MTGVCPLCSGRGEVYDGPALAWKPCPMCGPRRSDYVLDGTPEAVAIVRDARGLPPQCSAQTYRYEGGVQRADWCTEDAVMETEALDGSRSLGCETHGFAMIGAGATLVRTIP